MINTITINNYTIGNGSDISILGASGFGSASVAIGIINNAGRHGVKIPNHYWRERRIRLQLGLRSATVAGHKTLREDLFKAFALPRTGIATMYFTTTDGRSMQLDVALASEIDAPFEAGRVTSSVVRVELLAASPYVLDQTQNDSEASLPVAGGVAIPAAIPLSLTTSGGSVVINNQGNAIYKPVVITITGPVTSPTLRNNTSGLSFTIDYALGASDSVVIDCEDETVVLNGSTNLLSSFDGDFWQLEPGSNTILFSASTYDAAALATIRWRNSWSGI